MITDLRLAMPLVSQKSQEPGAYVMQSALEANNALREEKESGIYVKQAQMKERAIAGTAELNRAFNNEPSAVCTKKEPVAYVMVAKMPRSAFFFELTEEFKNVAESSQREANAQHYQEKSRNKCAKKQCTKLACG